MRVRTVGLLGPQKSKANVAVLVALTLLGSPAHGQSWQTVPMPAGYDDPGPPPANVLPLIVNRLRTVLKDPYSIRDFTLCGLERIEAYNSPLGWQRARWISKITLNSRNAYAGYTGSTNYTVTFSDGVVAEIKEFRGIDALPPSVNARLMATAQACPRVPEAEIQRILQGDGITVGSAERG